MINYFCKVQLLKNGSRLDFNFTTSQYQDFLKKLNSPESLFIQVGKEVDAKVDIVLSRKSLEETTITMKYVSDEK